MAVKQLSDKSFHEEVVELEIPVLVDFYADWCGPCRLVAPEVEAVSADLEGRIKVGKLDIDANPETAQRYGVLSIPTLLIFSGGKEIKRIVGARPRSELKAEIEAHLSIGTGRLQTTPGGPNDNILGQ